MPESALFYFTQTIEMKLLCFFAGPAPKAGPYAILSDFIFLFREMNII